MAEPKDVEERELVAEVQTFISEAEGASSDERTKMRADLDFVYSEEGQWDQATLTKRHGRPSYTFNRVLGPVNQVIGEERMFRPSIALRGVDKDTDQALAEVMSGLIRNIEALSDAESIYDMAFKYAVAGGYGAWRILPKYQNDRSFVEELFVEPIHNPFTVFFDPLDADPVKRNQNQCAITERISKARYEAQYGESSALEIRIGRDNQGWVDSKSFRVAEYFKRVPVKKEIALLSDGRTVPYDDEMKRIEKELEAAAQDNPDIPRVEKTRTVDSYQVKWWKVDGARILEGPITYDWTYIPVVKLPGRYVNIEGK
jgi:hypothetical protein